jgi:hypothetical protein
MRSKGNSTLVAVFVSMFAMATIGLAVTVPHPYDFETGSDGDSIIDQSNGWVAADADAGLIKAEVYSYSGAKPLPDPHTKILSITSDITNEVTSTGSEIVYVDTMIDARPWDQDNAPVPPGDAQTAAYVNTNGQLVIWHKEGTNKVWTALENTSITTGQWFRLTFMMDYVNDLPGTFGVKGFGVIIDGQAISNSTGAAAGTDGEMFIMANQGTAISSVSFSGTAKIDDFQYTTSDPNTTTLYTILSSVDDANKVMIDPLGTSYVAESNSITYAITTVSNGTIGDVLVDGASVGAVTSYTFSVVTTNHTIAVSAGASQTETANGVPFSWLTDQGLGTNDTTDTDLDGVVEWQEYVAGTDPNDIDSLFEILDVTYANGSNSVTYYATTNNGVADGINIMRSIDLTDSNAWTEVGTSIPRAADGTNTWWDTTPPADVPAFYKPVIIWVVN